MDWLKGNKGSIFEQATEALLEAEGQVGPLIPEAQKYYGDAYSYLEKVGVGRMEYFVRCGRGGGPDAEDIVYW